MYCTVCPRAVRTNEEICQGLATVLVLYREPSVVYTRLSGQGTEHHGVGESVLSSNGPIGRNIQVGRYDWYKIKRVYVAENIIDPRMKAGNKCPGLVLDLREAYLLLLKAYCGYQNGVRLVGMP